MDLTKGVKIWLSSLLFIVPTRTTIQQTKQAASILKKIYDEESLNEEDWFFIAGVGMTIAFMLYDNCSNIEIKIPSYEVSQYRKTSRKKKPKN